MLLARAASKARRYGNTGKMTDDRVGRVCVVPTQTRNVRSDIGNGVCLPLYAGSGCDELRRLEYDLREAGIMLGWFRIV